VLKDAAVIDSLRSQQPHSVRDPLRYRLARKGKTAFRRGVRCISSDLSPCFLSNFG
jgi:hypothetical protein